MTITTTREMLAVIRLIRSALSALRQHAYEERFVRAMRPRIGAVR